jgi:exopolysaccharide biosynthesis polyprenyl glycosylphosphotransferase
LGTERLERLSTDTAFGNGEEQAATAPRFGPRQSAFLVLSGRIAAALIPAAAIILSAADGSWIARTETATVHSFVWSVAAAIGSSLGGAASTALGPRVAVGRGVLLGLLGSAATDTWLPSQHVAVVITFMIAAAAFASGAWWESFALRHVVPSRRLLIVGNSAGALCLISDIRSGRGRGYVVVGTVHDEQLPIDSYVARLGSIADLGTVIESAKPDLVVLAPGPNRPEAFQELLDAAEAGFRVIELAQFYEYAYGRVPVENLTRAWFMSVLHLYQRPYSQLSKRTLDIVCAYLLFILTLPLFPLLALLVRQTAGPMILRQVRLGEHGKLFTMYKFRTMCIDAESAGRAVWAAADDARVTRVGRIMRRLRLDELPQLWNVVRGDMSLVGPRPERPEFLEELTGRVPYWSRRHLVKPGLTGWAQVRQGYAASASATSEKLSYDLWYVRHRSLTVDIAILLRTFAVVLRGDSRERGTAANVIGEGQGSSSVGRRITQAADRVLSRLSPAAAAGDGDLAAELSKELVRRRELNLRERLASSGLTPPPGNASDKESGQSRKFRPLFGDRKDRD